MNMFRKLTTALTVAGLATGAIQASAAASAQTRTAAPDRAATLRPVLPGRPFLPGSGTPFRSSTGRVPPQATAPEGAAGSGGWKVVPSPSPQAPNGQLLGVACSSSTACEAVGSYLNSSNVQVTFAEGWNGTRWALQATPKPKGAAASILEGVACPSPAACEAVGYYLNSSGEVMTLAEGWNSARWALQASPNPAGAVSSVLFGVACRPPAACEAVGDYLNSSGEGGTLAERWNGTKWALQATPNPKGAASSLLSGVACRSPAACEAVGDYLNSSGDHVSLAERWNGTKWALQASPSPTGATSSVLFAVACPSPADCEAVGYYAVSSGAVVTLADRWNGAKWALQASPSAKGATGSTLEGVACPSSAGCEATGFYTNSSGDRVTLAERWNGTKWALQAAPNPKGATESILGGVACPSPASCEAVGDYLNSSGDDVTLAERWNGTKWAIQASPNPKTYTTSTLNGVACPSPAACEAVGFYTNSSGEGGTLAERWNSTKWAIQASPNPTGPFRSELDGIACPSSTVCEAVGYYANSSGELVLAERWNGTKWALQAAPNPKGATGSILDQVACLSPAACEAVGFYTNSSGEGGTLAERWNGTKWTLQATPNPTSAASSNLDGVACPSSTVCEAVGYYANSSGEGGTLAERWNGTKWALQATPNPTSATASNLVAVACPSSTLCEAVGYHLNSSEEVVTLAERWNGTKWALQATHNPTGAIGSFLDAVACPSSTDCEAVGYYTTRVVQAVTLAEAWSGTSWVVQAAPVPAGATASSMDGAACSKSTDCEAVGSYLNSLGIQVTLVERWSS